MLANLALQVSGVLSQPATSTIWSPTTMGRGIGTKSRMVWPSCSSTSLTAPALAPVVKVALPKVKKPVARAVTIRTVSAAITCVTA